MLCVADYRMMLKISRSIRAPNHRLVIDKSSIACRYIHSQRSLKCPNIKVSNFNNPFIRLTINNRNPTYTQLIDVKEYSTNKYEDTRVTKELDRHNIGLSNFMSKVYTKTLFGVLSSIGTSLLASQICFSSPSAYYASFGIGILCGLGGTMGVTRYQPEYRTYEQNNEIIHYTENTPMREASYWIMTVGMGLTVTPLVTIIMIQDPIILPLSFFISTSILGGCAMYSTTSKDATMMQWKAPLAIGLSTLVGVQLVGIGSTLLLGPNMLSTMLYNMDIYGGIGLFTAMSIYDAYIARKMYLSGKADHLLCSVSLYLDFMNIWIRIMEILIRERNNRDRRH